MYIYIKIIKLLHYFCDAIKYEINRILKYNCIYSHKVKFLVLILIFLSQIYELKDKIAAFVCSGDLEVQERSSSALVLLECLKENPGLAQELIKTFEGELNPVAPKAQRKVGIN